MLVVIGFSLDGSRTIAPNPKTNTNPNSNPNTNRGAIFLEGSCPDTSLDRGYDQGLEYPSKTN